MRLDSAENGSYRLVGACFDITLLTWMRLQLVDVIYNNNVHILSRLLELKLNPP